MEKPCQSSISKLAAYSGFHQSHWLKSHIHRLIVLGRNWLNYVYQLTPFEIEEIGKIKEPIGTGSREDHGYAKTFTK